MESKGIILNIGKAAKLSNLTVKTVRYYADIGLVSPVKNNNTGYRDFSEDDVCLLYTSPSPRDKRQSRMPSSA